MCERVGCGGRRDVVFLRKFGENVGVPKKLHTTPTRAKTRKRTDWVGSEIPKVREHLSLREDCESDPSTPTRQTTHTDDDIYQGNSDGDRNSISDSPDCVELRKYHLEEENCFSVAMKTVEMKNRLFGHHVDCRYQ